LSKHPYARPAAEAVRYAEEQGRYWELRDALLKESAPPSAATISATAAEIHLEMKKFEECQSRHTFSPDVDAEESEAARLGINGAPAFLIGRPQDGKIMGTVIKGNRAIDVNRQEIERILNEGAEHADTLVGPSTTSLNPKDKPI
jgi:protein-disulfide isomerase